jgi:DinB superfamily
MGSMPDRPGRIGSEPAIGPLPGENHVCVDCRLDYSGLDVAAAVELISSIPARVRAVITATPSERLRHRPAAGGWSVTEYACHLRDVYVTSTIRLHRARTEDGPVLEPMLNDLRARRFRYNDANIDAVLDELASAVTGCIEEAGRFGPRDWQRTVTRLPGEHRTARWLVRHAAHEGKHHVADITRAAAW